MPAVITTKRGTGGLQKRWALRISTDQYECVGGRLSERHEAQINAADGSSARVIFVLLHDGLGLGRDALSLAWLVSGIASQYNVMNAKVLRSRQSDKHASPKETVPGSSKLGSRRHASPESVKTDIEQIWQHVEWIAAEPRYAETDRLEQCRAYCERHLTAFGWTVERRRFSAADQMLRSMNGINLVARRSPQAVSSSSVFVLGAHLDSRENTPGADDNASAVAVLLEIARLLGEANNAALPKGVDLELVVFDLEEQGMLGGAFHAETCRQQNRSLIGMVSLEMLGYCSHDPGSQTLPEGLQGIYPDVGNFIAVVGNQNSSDLIQHFADVIRLVDQLPCESLQVPDNGLPLPPTRLSDHSPFWDAGFPALMITDTSFMRNPHYHEPSDTPQTLDRDFLHKVAEGVLNAVSKLTG